MEDEYREGLLGIQRARDRWLMKAQTYEVDNLVQIVARRPMCLRRIHEKRD